MSASNRDNFQKLNLTNYYGRIPATQFNDLKSLQQRIQNKDAEEAARQINTIYSLSAIKDVSDLAAVTPRSPYYKMDGASSSVSEQQKWNEFVGRFGQAVGDWRQNNGGKIPSTQQEREIARQILFPQGTPAHEAEAGSFDAGRDRDAWGEREPAQAACAGLDPGGRVPAPSTKGKTGRFLVLADPGFQRHLKTLGSAIKRIRL